MNCPTATYRIQLSPDFTFDELDGILGYLEQFGISTIYSAPFFQARPGSTHGYDITDPFHLNREIGSMESFRKVSSWLEENNMSWLQDIVPNHMAFDSRNNWLRNIFELGPESKFYNYFDIDWKQGKVMAPFLGNPLEIVLEKKDLKLKFDDSGFSINYHENSYPISARSYAHIFSSEEMPEWKEKIQKALSDGDKWSESKNHLLKEVHRNPSLKKSLNTAVRRINASEAKLRKLLDLQYFQLVHWKMTEERINYRRFFTINDLICLRMEDPEVFSDYHSFIKDLVSSGFIDGLRIDHVDGLFDPLEYLGNLRDLVGNDFYIIIEKILEWDEKLPHHWPVQGTSGYGFLAAVNQVFTRSSAEDLFSARYQAINPVKEKYEDLVYHQKLFVLWERMGGEFRNLWNLSLELDLLNKEHQTTSHKNALGAFLAAFPVYRIYPEEFPLKKKQRNFIEQAYATALEHGQHLKEELNFLKAIFLGEAQKDRDNMFFFLQRCQQFTGPLAAKGVEDTTFYIFNRLISHNEVGDSPQNFGLPISGFHERMERRRGDFPLSINATATHDTKRGEDARMRINVLSELGREWFEKVQEWMDLSEEIFKDKAPDANEKYFIFQMLIGAYPFELEIGEEFLERTRSYLQKALREAKIHSSWAEPNVDYETESFEFIRSILLEERFLSSFLPFQKKIMAYGTIKSLGQSLVKVTAPGIPDIYQGTELWDLSYVDPDNRRPVDYKLRKKYLAEMSSISKQGLKEYLKTVKKEFSSGKIKMYCLFKALQERRRYREVFEKGDYIPLETRDPFKEQVLAFARKLGNDVCLVIVPVLVTTLFNEKWELDQHLFDLDVLELPQDLPFTWKNTFTGDTIDFRKTRAAKHIFEDFPVVLLTNS